MPAMQTHATPTLSPASLPCSAMEKQSTIRRMTGRLILLGHVRSDLYSFSLDGVELKEFVIEQASYRTTNVATKLKVTYVKDTLLNVSLR